MILLCLRHTSFSAAARFTPHNLCIAACVTSYGPDWYADSHKAPTNTLRFDPGRLNTPSDYLSRDIEIAAIQLCMSGEEGHDGDRVGTILAIH